MSGTYTIRTDSSITPVWHAHRKVPIEYCEQIEHTLDAMIKKGVIVPLSQPPEWVSFLTYPTSLMVPFAYALTLRTLTRPIV